MNAIRLMIDKSDHFEGIKIKPGDRLISFEEDGTQYLRWERDGEKAVLVVGERIFEKIEFKISYLNFKIFAGILVAQAYLDYKTIKHSNPDTVIEVIKPSTK